MNCQKCGSPLNEDNQCIYCSADSVKKLSTLERESFQGITIEDEHNENYRHQQYYEESTFQSRHRQGPKIKIFSMNLGTRTPVWKKFLYLLAGAAAVGLFFFFALPILFTVIGIGLLVFLINRLLS